MNISLTAFNALVDRIESMAKYIGAKDVEIQKLQEYVNELEMAPKPIEPPPTPTEKMISEIVEVCLAHPDNRVEQIKVVRRAAGLGLMEAKTIVDSIWRKLGKQLPFTA